MGRIFTGHGSIYTIATPLGDIFGGRVYTRKRNTSSGERSKIYSFRESHLPEGNLTCI